MEELTKEMEELKLSNMELRRKLNDISNTAPKQMLHRPKISIGMIPPSTE